MHNLLLEQLLLHFYFPFLEDEILTDNALPDVLDFLNDSFKVGSCVVRASDEYVVSLSRRYRRVECANCHEPVTTVSVVSTQKAKPYFS